MIRLLVELSDGRALIPVPKAEQAHGLAWRTTGGRYWTAAEVEALERKGWIVPDPAGGSKRVISDAGRAVLEVAP